MPKSIIIDKNGGPEVLVLQDVEVNRSDQMKLKLQIMQLD